MYGGACAMPPMLPVCFLLPAQQPATNLITTKGSDLVLSHQAALLVDTNVLEECANSICRAQASRVQIASCKEG